jgi:hypothetical protein
LPIGIGFWAAKQHRVAIENQLLHLAPPQGHAICLDAAQIDLRAGHPAVHGLQQQLA